MTAGLRERIAGAPGRRAADQAVVLGPTGRLTHAEIAATGPSPEIAADARVAVCLSDPLTLVRTLAALDGHVAGILLLTAGISPPALEALAETAGCDLVVSDRADLPGAMAPEAALGDAVRSGTPRRTEWMMTTSGTTGLPKIVPHTLDSLARTVRRAPLDRAPVWGLVLEPTRFAGLQVVLQALLGGGTLAVTAEDGGLAKQIDGMAGAGVTHLSATPTLWRRLLMAPGMAALPLRQITMGGEIADQAVLDAARARFPEARLTHIYASTEAGVGFAVNDGRAGFPAGYTETAPGGVGVKIKDGALWLRPPGDRTARYLGGQTLPVDTEGYVATGDRIEVTGGRAYFLGRDSGVVNVGGVKVWPERVERTIAAVPGVGLAQVVAKKSPITGALLTATVVPARPETDRETLRTAILAACRAELEREAVPARITFAEHIETNAAGKILRS